MGIDRKTEVQVTNRQSGHTGYKIEDYNLQGGNLTRNFAPGETKTVTVGELESLLSSEGGRRLFENYLIVKDKEVLDYLNRDMNVEPEYYYGDDEIKNMILNGSLDEFEDCLNFAPVGVIERIKQLAVQLEMPDHRKRQLILEKTGFNVDNSIIVNKAMADDTEPATPVEAPKRKAGKKNAEAAETKKERKTAAPKANPDYEPPKYEVVG